jgi:hypothetical protein
VGWGYNRGKLFLHVLILGTYFKNLQREPLDGFPTLYKSYFVIIMAPRDKVMGPCTIGEIVFTCAYIGNIFKRSS